MIKNLVREAKRIAGAWSDAQTGTYGAAVAYYTVFSIAPLLIIALAVVGLFADSASAQANLISQFRGTFGSSGADLVRELITASAPHDTSIVLAVVGFVAVLLGATAIFSALQAALDRIFATQPDKREGTGIVRAIVVKLVSVGMVLSLGFVLLASLAASALIHAASSRIVGPGVDIAARVAETGASLVLIALFLALMLKLLPTKRLAWKPALVGGALSSVGFAIGKYALGLYLGSTESPYGAASGIVLIILWAYYLSQVFFASAIVAKLYWVGKR